MAMSGSSDITQEQKNEAVSEHIVESSPDKGIVLLPKELLVKIMENLDLPSLLKCKEVRNAHVVRRRSSTWFSIGLFSVSRPGRRHNLLAVHNRARCSWSS